MLPFFLKKNKKGEFQEETGKSKKLSPLAALVTLA